MLKPDMAWSEIWSARRFERLHKRKGSCSIQFIPAALLARCSIWSGKKLLERTKQFSFGTLGRARVVCLCQRLDRLMRAERLALHLDQRRDPFTGPRDRIICVWTSDLIAAILGRNRNHGRQDRINSDLSCC